MVRFIKARVLWNDMEKDLLNYVSDGMFMLVEFGAVYIGATGLISGLNTIFSEKIKSQEDLERIVSEEKAKLGIDKPIKSTFFKNKFRLPRARKGENDGYEIEIGGFFSDRSTVRHELYHLFRHVENGRKGKLYYHLVEEPQAVAYEAFGLKL